jgi:tetratricopeptide (TPR) repeat protein
MNYKGMIAPAIGVILVIVMFVIVCGNPVQEQVKKGDSFFEQEQYDNAIAAYTKAIELYPKPTAAYDNRGLAKIYENRGLAYYKKGDCNKAIAEYTSAIEIDPKYGPAYNNRSVAYWAIKEYDKSRADLKQAAMLLSNVIP